MATFHINRGGTNLGTFSEDEVRDGLRSGKFFGTDLGWREGMPTWQPLAQIPEIAQETSAGAASPLPQAAGSGTALNFGMTAAPRSGLPWDDRQQKGFFSAFIETLQMVLTRPAEAFTVMKREGGFGEPLIYAVVGGSVGAIVSFLFSLLFHSFGMFTDQRNPLAAMAGMGIGSIGFIILVPLAIVICLFIV